MEEKDKMRQNMLYEDIRHGYYHLLPKELYSLLVTSVNEYDKRTVRIWSQEKPRYHIMMEKMTVRGVAFEDRKGIPGYFIRLNPKHFISFADKYFDKELKKKKAEMVIFYYVIHLIQDIIPDKHLKQAH